MLKYTTNAKKFANIPLSKRFHPGVKFFCFVASIIFIFFANSFFSQLILLSFLIVLYSCCRMKKSTTLLIVKSFIVMFILFVIINWFFYKNPVAFKIDGFNLIGGENILNSFTWNYHVNGVYISQIYGGDIYTQINYDLVQQFASENASTIDKWFNAHGGDLSQLNLINFNGFENADESTQKALVYMMNNDFSINGIKYRLHNINTLNAHHGLNYDFSNIFWYSTKWYTFSPTTIIKALYISTKIVCILLVSSMLTETTTSVELASGLETILCPLKIIKFPVNEASMIVAIAIRFIPSLLSESKRILNAQAARGVDFNNGNIFIKMKSLVSLVIPLFSIAFKNSEELANAMDARGYNPKAYRTKYRIYHFAQYDFWLLFLIALFGTFVIAYRYMHIFFTFFGVVEGDLLF